MSGDLRERMGMIRTDFFSNGRELFEFFAKTCLMPRRVIKKGNLSVDFLLQYIWDLEENRILRKECFGRHMLINNEN